MSNRVFKKVYGGDDDLKQVSPESEDEQPIAFASKKGTRVVRNPYELLNELSESEAKEDDGNADNDGAQNSSDSSKTGQNTSQATKKKKRKKKPAKKKKQAGGSGSDKAFDTELEDEEAQKRQRAKFNGGKKEKENADRSHNSKPLALFEEMFKIDPKFLSSEFELKKIFGAKVINYERSKQGQRRIYRHSKLVMPKEQWPSVSGSGISMSYLNTIDGFMYFKYDHSSHYMDVQKQFMKAVDTLNPDNIVNILRLYPYHIDSHIQLSDMAKAAEDMQVAADLIEGAVHCLENAFHARFNLCIPSCRLEYKYQENRPFFILLFKHLTFVGQRACHRTALELCKRLLCLDPVADPLCVTLMIDFYALKAGEVQWFINLYNYWEKTRNLDQLPNFSFSVALAYHILSTKTDASSSKNKSASSESEEFSQKADTMIQYAILMFPSVLLPLLEKVGVQIDSRAKNHSYFNVQAQNSQSRSLKLLCELYVWRTYHVWREPTVLSWLEKNVHIVLDKVDVNDPIVKDYEGKRKRRYQATTPRNILRHVLLTDNKDLTVNLPPELSKEPILNYDPLPPPDAVDIYNMKDFRTPITAGTRRNGILHMLLSSLVNDLNAPPNPNNDRNLHLQLEDAAAAVVQGQDPPIAVGAGLQQSVTALLDAMRDLLSNANTRPEGEAEAADGEESASDIDDVD